MGQIVFNGQKPKYCNLSAITTGSMNDYVIPNGEVWLIDSTNVSKTDGKGKYDYYIIGNNGKTASQLAATKIKIDDSEGGSVIDTVTITVDDNAGIPSGSATVSGTTLNFNFSGLKGSKGDTGEKGDKGDQGIPGEKGEDGRITEVNHGTNDTTFALTPNVHHVWGEVTSLNLTLATGDSRYANEYSFRFFSGSTPTVLTLPQTVQWVQPLTIQQDKYYEVSIINNLAAYITSGMVAAETSGSTPDYATKDWVTNKLNTELYGGIYYE